MEGAVTPAVPVVLESKSPPDVLGAAWDAVLGPVWVAVLEAVLKAAQEAVLGAVLGAA